MKFTKPLAFAVASLVAAPAFAEEQPELVFSQDSVAAMQGDIVIEAPYGVDDVITSVSSEAAEKADLAEYEGRGKDRKTNKLEEIETPGNNAVMMDQDGYHVVLSDLKEPIKNGETIPLILNFAETGELKVEVSVSVLE